MLSKVAAKNGGTCCSNGLGLVNNCPTCGPICQNNTATSSLGKLPFCSYNLFWSTHVSVLPQTHPNPPASFTVSFTWGFLLNAKNRCLATKYSPCRNLLDYYFFPSFTFLRGKKKRERDIFVMWSLQIPVVHKQWYALQKKCTTLRHIYRAKNSCRHTTGVSGQN